MSRLDSHVSSVVPPPVLRSTRRRWRIDSQEWVALSVAVAVLLVTGAVVVSRPSAPFQFVRPGAAGSFTFAPPGSTDQRITVWYDAPEENIDSARVLVVMPGRQRNGEQYRDEWAPYAQRHDALLIVPELSDEIYPGSAYNTGNLVDESGDPLPRKDWAFSPIEPLFDAVIADTDNTSTGYLMYGHSAGAQFVHRFLLFQRGHRVQRAVSANAGWYTAIDDDAPFPYGLKDSPARASVVKALGFPLALLLGEEDNDPDSDGLRTTRGAMAQGDHRLARGRYFYESGREAARRLHVAFRWSVVTVPNAGHHDEQMAPAAAELLFD